MAKKKSRWSILGGVFLLIIAGSAFFYRQKVILVSDFRIQAGRNYSLLIDRERIPIKTQNGETLQIRILRRDGGFDLPVNRVVIMQRDKDTLRGRPTRSRFRFTYDTPRDLLPLYQGQRLETLRGMSEWATVENVLKWAFRQIKVFGSPSVYPSQDANEIIPLLASGKLKGFCAHYCYLTVQALQALGFVARYITIQGHEICEVWLPRERIWVALDPTHNGYFINGAGKKLSALGVARAKRDARFVSATYHDAIDLRDGYTSLWYWLRNDLVTHPTNVYDLNKYRCRAILSDEQVNELSAGDLYTLYPDELYEAPENSTQRS